MKKIKLNLNSRSYFIYIGRNALNSLGGILDGLNIGSDAFVITNDKIKRLHSGKLEKVLKKSGYSVKYKMIQDSERAKAASVCIEILNKIALYDRKKRVFIIAFGGGVIGDTAGFVASVYRRGVPYIQIPTTLLSQLDSAIGGKVAIDLAVGKNLAGSFYQPRAVLSDISLLESLPFPEIRNGLAEAVKYGIIKDPALFTYLEKNYKKAFKFDPDFLARVICKCSKIKAGAVEKDERDKKDIRIMLNYGHTIGHAIESAGNYKTYVHGEAVGIGMLVEALLSYKLGLITEQNLLRIERVLENMGLPTRIKNLNLSKILKAQDHDKKIISGVNRFVLPTKIGSFKVCENIPRSLIEASLKERTA